MKTFRPVLLIAVLMLAGCAGSGSHTGSTSGSTRWNPLSWSWSSLAPWHWFGSALQVTELGVGGITGNTAMKEEAIADGLDGKYQLRQGMRSANGDVVSFWQALGDNKQIKLELSGNATVNRIDVTDADISTASGVKIGTPFRDLYSKAFGACQKGSGADSDSIECNAPGSQHISYLFSGEWHGPEELMPADDTLKNWTLSEIIWRARVNDENTK